MPLSSLLVASGAFLDWQMVFLCHHVNFLVCMSISVSEFPRPIKTPVIWDWGPT